MIFPCIFFVIFFDQVTKFLVYSNLELNDIYSFGCLGGFFSICYFINSGLAFSLFSDYKYIRLFIVFSRILLLFLLGRSFYKKKEDERSWIGTGFICGGGISNTIDLFVHRGVVDMLYCDLIGISGLDFFYNISFNLADIFILVGILYCFIVNRKL